MEKRLGYIENLVDTDFEYQSSVKEELTNEKKKEIQKCITNSLLVIHRELMTIDLACHLTLD
jgi:hypothetical protein